MSHTPPADSHSTHAHDDDHHNGHDTAETEVAQPPPKPIMNKVALVLIIALLLVSVGWYQSYQKAARLQAFIDTPPPTWMREGQKVPYSDNCPPPAAAPVARPPDAGTTTPKATAP